MEAFNKRVVVTGSEGVVGKVLSGYTIAQLPHPGLSADTLTRVDVRPERGSAAAAGLGVRYNQAPYVDRRNPFMQHDLHDEGTLRQLLENHDTWIHGAWGGSGIIDPTSHNKANMELIERLLRSAQRLGPLAAPKIVLLSSVNAHVPVDWRERQERGELITVHEPPQPHCHNRDGKPGPGYTRYGEAKIEMEGLARQYASDGLDVTVLRLGGLNLADSLPSTYAPYIAMAASAQGAHFDLGWEDAVRLRHSDFVDTIQGIVDRSHIPGHFALSNLVSANLGQVHQL